MHRLLGPICLFLALAMVMTGFGLLAFGPPVSDAQLPAARASGDDRYADALEARQDSRQQTRTVLLVCLFGGSVVFTVIAFSEMRPS